MKIKVLLSVLLFLLFSAGAANAQHYRHGGYRGGYHRGYHRRGPAVVIAPPRPVVVVRPGGGYHRGYHRGYYRGGPRRGYGYRHHRHGRW